MSRFPSSAHAISMLALLISLGGAGYSATGGNFILGQANSAATQTKLAAPINGPAFRIDNLNTGASAAGLSIITNAARPPLVVNSGVKVANLNADKLDGLDADAFPRVGADTEGVVSSAGLPPNTCVRFNLQATGAQVGDAVIMTPKGVLTVAQLLFAEGVSARDSIRMKLCNPTSATSGALSDFKVRIVTLR
jgi:hypothetical protein